MEQQPLAQSLRSLLHQPGLPLLLPAQSSLALLEDLAQFREADAAERVSNVSCDPEELDAALQGQDQVVPLLGQDVAAQICPAREHGGETLGQTDERLVHSLGSLAPGNHPH